MGMGMLRSNQASLSDRHDSFDSSTGNLISDFMSDVKKRKVAPVYDRGKL